MWLINFRSITSSKLPLFARVEAGRPFKFSEEESRSSDVETFLLKPKSPRERRAEGRE